MVEKRNDGTEMALFGSHQKYVIFLLCCFVFSQRETKKHRQDQVKETRCRTEGPHYMKKRAQSSKVNEKGGAWVA